MKLCLHCSGPRAAGMSRLRLGLVMGPTRASRLSRALIEAISDRADEAGCPAFYWMTQEFNQAARQLYDRMAKLTPSSSIPRF
jgi:hypothetical protein